MTSFDIADDVVIVITETPATVVGVLHRADGITYEIAFWFEGARLTEWVADFEIYKKPRGKLV